MNNRTRTFTLLLVVTLSTCVCAKRVHRSGKSEVGSRIKDHKEHGISVKVEINPNLTSVPTGWFQHKWESVWAPHCTDADFTLIEATSGLIKLKHDTEVTPSHCAWVLTKLKTAEVSEFAFKRNIGETIGDVEILGNLIPKVNLLDSAGNLITGKNKWTDTKEDFAEWVGETIRASAHPTAADEIRNKMMGNTAHKENYNFLVLGMKESTNCWKVEHAGCRFHGEDTGAFYAAIVGNYNK